MSEFQFTELLNLGTDETDYRLLTEQSVTTASFGGKEMLMVDPAALTLLAESAMHDVAHLLRASHMQQLRLILDDPEASPNDRYVALELIKNACIAAGMTLPSCQDTGTAIVMAKKGDRIWTGGGDKEALSKGIYNIYTKTNLRYSQVAPITLYEERNTGTNLPAQIDIEAVEGKSYSFLFLA